LAQRDLNLTTIYFSLIAAKPFQKSLVITAPKHHAAAGADSASGLSEFSDLSNSGKTQLGELASS
jgi:hypothetical protein